MATGRSFVEGQVSRRAVLGGAAGIGALAGLATFGLPAEPARALGAAPGGRIGAAPGERRAVGAKTPFVTFEAENGVLGGHARVRSIGPGSPVATQATLESEASSYGLVELADTGDSVTLRNTSAVRANTLVVRASIPDAPTGGGIEATLNLYVDGRFRQAIPLDSKQAWLYRDPVTTDKTKDPSSGIPLRFYNEFPVWVTGAPIAPGSRITLRKDAANTASAYHIDCVDLERVAPPLKRPHNALSVVDYGADPSFQKDSTTAIQDAVDDARARGRSVWIPAGKYLTNSLAPTPLDFTGVAVHGAGMWHTILYRAAPLTPVIAWRSKTMVGSGTTLTDLQIDSNATVRQIGVSNGADYGIEAHGAGGWLIERVWTRHCDANWLSGNNAVIQDCRTADSYGDGYNVNNSNVPDPDKLGQNITVHNNFARGTGDDSFAAYSDAGATGDSAQVAHVRIVNNTAAAPWWANGIRVAGGQDIQVVDNLVVSVSSDNAMDIGVFGDTGHPLESATVSGNVLHGGGGWNGVRHGVHIASPSKTSLFPDAYTHVTLMNNLISGSPTEGLFIDTKLDQVTVTNNTIENIGAQGIRIAAGVTGGGALTGNAVRWQGHGQAPYQNDSPSTFTPTLRNNSWQHR